MHRSSILLGLVTLATGLVQYGSVAVAEETNNTPKGKELLEKQGCLHCHYIRGDGGLIGPPFEGIGKFRSEDDIVTLLTKKRSLPPSYPKSIVDPREFMRHVRLDKKTAQEIARYILTTPVEEPFEVRGHGEDVPPKGLPEGFKFQPHPASENSRKGLIAFKESGCAACHSIGGMGGRRGPELDGIGARLSRANIENRVSNGAILFFGDKEYKPTEYAMPPSQLAPEQIAQITEFLLTLPRESSK
ncbi:MAG: cytochrome c [Candidatus Obscuribacterales bacterium]|nr:cytochrome c [Candidatus Obscuribacterales bacterium]